MNWFLVFCWACAYPWFSLRRFPWLSIPASPPPPPRRRHFLTLELIAWRPGNLTSFGSTPQQLGVTVRGPAHSSIRFPVSPPRLPALPPVLRGIKYRQFFSCAGSPFFLCLCSLSLPFFLKPPSTLFLSLLGEGNGNPLQNSCLENSIDRGTWWATVHGVANSWTRLSNWSRV